jgi:hypothetical protein
MRTTLAISMAGLLLSPQLAHGAPIDRPHGHAPSLDWRVHGRRMTEGAGSDFSDLGTFDILSPLARPDTHDHSVSTSSTSNLQLLGYVRS